MALFYGGELRAVLDRQRRSLVGDIDGWDPDQLLGQSEQEIVGYLVDKYRVEPLVLDVNGKYADEPEDASGEVIGLGGRPVRVSTTRVVVHVPFSGDPALFSLRASTYGTNLSSATVGDSELLFVYEETDPEPARINSRLDEELRRVEEGVRWTNGDVAAHNDQLEPLARAEVTKRKDKLLRDRQLSRDLGMPIRRRADAPPRPVPVLRIRVERPAPVSSEFEPEFAINEAAYEEAVRVIVAFGRQLERTPGTTSKLSEEELRDLFLGALNTQFEGQTGGELFNGSGKTDILIRVEDRNVFIAECKFWTGAKAFNDAIDQLLRYLVWRDTKAALMLFIRNQDATAVIAKAVEVLSTRALRVLPSSAPSERSDFVLLAERDPAREIRVALLPFVSRAEEDE